MNISDEMLMAYADGELDAGQRAQVEQALEQDAQLAAKLAGHRALQRRLHRELDGVLSEPVPERLLDALKAPAARPAAATDLQARRAAKQKHRWSLGEWSAMAACLVAAVGLGFYMWTASRGTMITSHFGGISAGGQLVVALNKQLAGTQSPSDAVQIGISFRNHDGEYCRTFEIDQSHVAGLACNDGKDWRVRLLTPSERRANGEYRQAGSAMPAAVLTLVEQEIAGEALDAEQEAAARDAHWNE